MLSVRVARPILQCFSMAGPVHGPASIHRKEATMILSPRLLPLLLLASCRPPGIADDNDDSSARPPPAVLALRLEGDDVTAPVAWAGGTMRLDQRSIELDEGVARAMADPASTDFG